MAFIESGRSIDKEKHRQKMKKLMENMDITRCTVRIPTHIHNKFKLKLLKNRINMKLALLGMILNYIENED